MTDSDLADPPLTPTETDRRLPSLALIDDNDLRNETRHLARFAPAYFWTRAGSTSGYHHPREHGLWAHTLAVSTVIERNADSYTERDLLHEEDIDRAHAVAVLHDMRKAGEDGDQTRSDHDLRMAAVLRETRSCDELVERAIAEHMGPWYEGPDPSSTLAELVHIADMIASADESGIQVALPEPVPEELREAGYEGVEL